MEEVANVIVVAGPRSFDFETLWSEPFASGMPALRQRGHSALQELATLANRWAQET